jgi:hypothetical protein
MHRNREICVAGAHESTTSLESPYLALQAIHDSDLALMERHLTRYATLQAARAQTSGTPTTSAQQGAATPSLAAAGGALKHILKSQGSGSGGSTREQLPKQPCIFAQTLHMTVLHKQYELTQMLLNSGMYDVNQVASCVCDECGDESGQVDAHTPVHTHNQRARGRQRRVLCNLTTTIRPLLPTCANCVRICARTWSTYSA